MGEKNKHGEEEAKKTPTPHDEAFKKLLQTFFAEFIALFFPELDKLLDHSHTRLLMQELLIDIVGQEARSLDLLIETKYKLLDAFILVHMEPQSYNQSDFNERMFIYFSRLFEKYRKIYKIIIPIAIFSADDVREEPDSDNPVAAALLAKMGYNKKEEREVRTAYLRMILRLQNKLDDARLALIMSVADLYFELDIKRDQEILHEISKEYPEEGERFMKLMPGFARVAYEEGIEKGIEQGIVQGIEKGIEQGIGQGEEKSKKLIIQKFLRKGFTPEQLAETLEISIDEVKELGKQ